MQKNSYLRRGPVKSRGKWRAFPLELSEVCECLMEDVGGEGLCFRTITNSPRHISIDAVKVLFVQLGKAAWVVLSSFDQEPFFGFSCLTQV